jgi:GNAT superfamily N-acetyltransferase
LRSSDIAAEATIMSAGPADVSLRPPRADEYDALAALCRRAKAVWGYDDAFMARCAPVLRVDPVLAADGLVVVAERAAQVVGVCQVSLEGPTAELDLLFVAPEAHRAGIGRRLMSWAAATARVRGASELRILSDPGARPFYEVVGARYLGEAPSDVIPGRRLPLLVLPLA